MPKRSPADTLASLERGSDHLCDTQNGKRYFVNDVLEEFNSVRSENCWTSGASSSGHVKVDVKFEALHNHPCRFNTDQFNRESTLKSSGLYPCTTLSSPSSRDGASPTSAAAGAAFHVKNELTEILTPTSQWCDRNRVEEDTSPSVDETVQGGGVHDIAKSTTDAVSLDTQSEYSAHSGEQRSCKRSTEDVLQSQVLIPSTRPFEKSSQSSSADCDSAWALGYIDLRNTGTPVVQARTPAMAMPSYNLKNQSQSLPHSKEASSANAAVGVRTVFQCHTCQKEFVTEKYLCMHMALHRPQASSNCPASSAAAKQANSKFSISQSVDDSVKLIKSDGTGASHWTCKICSKTFAQSSNYKNHIRTHSDERPFVCNVCSIGFKERYHLKKHILFKHTKELKEECRVCGKRFKDSTAVRAHERIHSEERPYGCQRCNKTFKTSECLWHHENRSRTCGKALKGTADADGVMTPNPVPRFRRGRHPGKRTTAPSKSKKIAEAEENSIGEASACLSLDHVEEISASVKIELERDIPEYYFKAVPGGLYAYEFDNIMDVLMPDGSLPTGQEVTFPSSQLSVNAPDVVKKSKQLDNDLHRSVPSSISATLGSRHLDHIAAQLWSNEWTSSSVGVFLGSPSRPVSASYDSIADTYSPGTSEKSWKQDISNFRHGSAVYIGEISNADLVKSPNFNLSHSTQQKQLQQQAGQQMQLSTASAVNCATTTATGGLPFASVMQQISEGKADIRYPGSMQTSMQPIRRSYADDFGPTDEASRSVLALTSISASDLWTSSKLGEAVPVVGGPSRIQESAATNAAASTSYPISSIANVPTAVVAPFKRESTNRPTQVNGTEADQPVKNSLPPFETFAPMTLRVQKSQQAMISTPIPSLSPIASYATFANPYSSDGSIADQCPTIQKYLLRGHPNVAIKPNRNLPDYFGQHEISVNRQWHTLSPVRPLTLKDTWKRPNVHSHHIEMEQDRSIAGRQLVPEFISESQIKLSGLVSLPGEMDATQSFNFIKMAPASYSQSAILQPLADVGDSNASSVNLHRKI